jgi:hypothetical protein
MAQTYPTGEPYRLRGHRLVFTGWHFIRTGGLGWYDAEGRTVTVGGDLPPGDAVYRTTDMPRGIRIVTRPAQRLPEPVISPLPGERYLGLGTILPEDGRYRAWAVRITPEAERTVVHLTSDDGWTWGNPEPVTGNPDTRDPNLVAFTTVFVDPSAPPEERYKAVSEYNEFTQADLDAYAARYPGDVSADACGRQVWQHIGGIKGWVSPDGLHWRGLELPLVITVSDTQVVAEYDAARGQYVMYTREWSAHPQDPAHPNAWGWVTAGRRAIGRTASADFRHFPLPEMILEPGPAMSPTEVLYTNGKTAVPGMPEGHLLFPCVWDMAQDTTHVVLASGLDGKAWSYLPGGPVFATNTFGAWDGGCLFASPALLELPDGAFALPYGGYNVPHKYPRGRWLSTSTCAVGYALWPQGRMIGVEAPEAGEFTTVTFVPPGNRLRLNAVTARAGCIRIEAARPDGTPIPGHAFADAVPLCGDCFRTPVAWSGGDTLGIEANEPVMLRVRMERATIYGLEFR